MNMENLSARQASDNADYARAWNKQIREGRRFYAVSPLNGLFADVTQFRTRKGHLQAKSLRTDKWLGVTYETVKVAM